MKATRLALVVVCLAFGKVSFGQVITGTIAGTVKDSSGAVLPGASVQVKNTGTGEMRTSTTDARGFYTTPNLAPGAYEVSATLNGFQTEVHPGITVNVSQTAVIDFSLKVGAVTERVEVTAEAPLVETTNAVVTGLVNEKQVRDLPLNNRSLLDLPTLETGVLPVSQVAAPGASKGMGAKISISGTRYNANLYQTDGADINDISQGAGSASGNLMGAESIREFSVVTNAYSAEYGKHSGGVFNAITKSGTNSLHGSLFEFLRNDKLDASRWEDNKNLTTKPEFRRNQFGGSLGGPIKRDRTFFFGSYEGLRQRLGNASTFGVATPELRLGNITDPTTGAFVRHVDIAPQVQPFVDFYPLPSPNGLRLTGGAAQQLFLTAVLPTKEDYFTTREDHKLSDKDTLFVRYTFSSAYQETSSDLAADNFQRSRQQSSTIGYTRIVSPQMVNQFLLSWARNNLTDADAVIHPGLKLPAGYQMTTFPGSIGAFSVTGSGLSGYGNEGKRNYMNQTFQGKDDFTYNRGNQTLKFGFNGQHNFQYANRHFNGQGAFTFTTIDNFLKGISSGFTALTANSEPTAYIRNQLWGLYVQDDWRLSPRLTLNLGLRYEFITIPQVEGGRVSTLANFVLTNLTPSQLILGNPTFLNPSLKNYAPRVGLAWDVTGSGKTSIRVGGGVFDDQINPGTYNFSFLSSLPFYNVGTITPGAGCTPTDPDPVPSFPDAFYVQQKYLQFNPACKAGNIEGFQYIPNQPVIYKWSFELQHEFGANLGATVSYSASRGVHLFRVVGMNSRLGVQQDGRLFIPSNAPLPDPQFGRVRPRFSDTTSNYNALLVSVKQRFSRRLQFQMSYTYSKSVDDESNFTGGSDFSNGPEGGRYRDVKDRGLSNFDIRQAFVTNASYQLPGESLKGIEGRTLGGWQLSGILTLRGGNPFNVTNGNPPGFFSGTSTSVGDLPDLVGPIKYDTRNADHYFDPSAFALPLGYLSAEQTALGGSYVGNAARDILISPGSATVNLVVEKGFRLTERFNLQFRSEFFNLLNRVNFGQPNGRVFAATTAATTRSTLLFNPQAGQITSSTGTPRQIQFGLRLEF